MPVSGTPWKWTRRAFFKIVGVTSGAIVASQIPGASAARPTAQPPSPGLAGARIGLLLPDSTLHPALGQNLAHGLRLGFARAAAEAGGAAPILIPARIGTGVASAVGAAERLVREERVDLLIGPVSSPLTSRLSPLLQASGALLVVTDAGTSVPRDGELDPNIFHSSLDYWRASWAMGEWAARHLGRRALIASSFYESGYDSLYAFQLGFESAGGSVAETFVSHVPPDGAGWDELIAAIRRARPDLVYALYSGPLATDFVQAYAAAGLAGQIPLAASPFTVDEAFLPDHGPAALGIRSVLPWAGGLATVENAAFVAAYREQTGRTPDAFALLGYDTARLVAAGLQAAGRAGGLRQALAGLRLSSPRGSLRMDAASQQTRSPLYLREVRQGASGLENAVVGVLDAVADTDPRLQSLRSSPRTGWLHPYLHL